MHVDVIWWVFSQKALTRKDVSQHCVLKAQLTNLFVLGNYLQLKLWYYLDEWHNATLADGHQHRHARELVRALSLSIRAQIPIQVWVPINLHPGCRKYVIATSAQFSITFDILKILLILLKNTNLFVCLFSWQIRAVISKGTWLRENILQPSTLPVFPWGSIQGCTQVQLQPGWIFLFNIIAQLSVEGRFMTFHAAEVCIYCNFFWIRLLMFQSAIRVFTSPLQFYWHFSPSFHLCYSLNFTLNHLSLLWRGCNAAPRHTAMIESTSEHFVYS